MKQIPNPGVGLGLKVSLRKSIVWWYIGSVISDDAY